MLYFVLIVTLIIGIIYHKKNNAKLFHEKAIISFRKENNFNPDYYQIMANNSGAIALDTNLKMICLIDSNLKAFYLTRNDIVTTEIMIDDETYTQKDYFKTWSKYFLLRSIGDNSIAEASVHISKERHVTKIDTIKLRIATKNYEKPNHYLLFLKYGNDKDKQMMMNDINDWITRIEIL